MGNSPRAAAFKNLLLGYDIIHGLMLLGIFGLLMLSGMREADPFFRVVAMVMLVVQIGGLAAANVGIVKRQSWGAAVALAHSAIWVLLMLIGQGRSASRDVPANNNASFRAGQGVGNVCPFIFHGLVILLAWRALKAPEDDAQPSANQRATDDAVNILALASSADGTPTPEKRALALQFASQLVGPVQQNFGFQQRVVQIASTQYPDQVLDRSTSGLQRSFTPEQKQWLIEAARAICQVHGEPEPLAEQFLIDLTARLHATPGQIHEPFGRAN